MTGIIILKSTHLGWNATAYIRGIPSYFTSCPVLSPCEAIRLIQIQTTDDVKLWMIHTIVRH